MARRKRELRYARHYFVECAGGHVAVYDEIETAGNYFYLVARCKKWGVIDSYGQVTVPLEYDYIRSFDRFVLVRKDYKVGIFSYRGKEIFPMYYSDVELDDLRLLDEGGDLNGAIRAWTRRPAYYNGAPSYQFNSVIAEFPSGKLLHDFKQNVNIERYKYGFALYAGDGRGWEFVDFTGKTIIQGSFNRVTMDRQYSVMRLVESPTKVRIVGRNGKTVYGLDCNKIKRFYGYENAFLARTNDYDFQYEIIVVTDRGPEVRRFQNGRDYFEETWHSADIRPGVIDGICNGRLLSDYGIPSV